MRDFEFRAWHYIGDRPGTMIHFGLFDTDEGYHIQQQKTLDECEIMQFTGMLDANGTKIFEGDLVEGVAGNNGGPSEVFYDCGRWWPFAYLGIFDGSRYKVVGNIYQNPDLLTESKGEKE